MPTGLGYPSFPVPPPQPRSYRQEKRDANSEPQAKTETGIGTVFHRGRSCRGGACCGRRRSTRIFRRGRCCRCPGRRYAACRRACEAGEELDLVEGENNHRVTAVTVIESVAAVLPNSA